MRVLLDTKRIQRGILAPVRLSRLATEELLVRQSRQSTMSPSHCEDPQARMRGSPQEKGALLRQPQLLRDRDQQTRRRLHVETPARTSSQTLTARPLTLPSQAGVASSSC